jgi:signal transduction histidine kinase
MNFMRRLAPKTIAAQIACLVVVAVVLGVGLSSVALIHFFYASQAGANGDILPAVRAARIAGIVHKAQEARPHALAQLESAYSPAVAVEIVALRSLRDLPAPGPRETEFVRAIKERLERNFGVTPLPYAKGDAIFVRVDDEDALKFVSTANMFPLQNLVLIQTTLALAIITVMVLLLSLYALRRITAPLQAIASAARSFGPNSKQDGANNKGELKGAGPREITQVAEALRDMSERMRGFIDERTKMLEAISHDLRTPLTRLRLRTERLGDLRIRDAMLRDIALINDMVRETLAYLRDGRSAEAVQLIDLPSLLQTICAEFADVGHDVTYHGPGHFAFSCRAHALSRAVANIVDNATKHGQCVTVTLQPSGNESATIEVSDDGPGIPSALREKAFEPFFKGDSARSSGRGGFGLGLAISRDIIRRQGGEILLRDSAPHGLSVVLSLGEEAVAGDQRAPAA